MPLPEADLKHLRAAEGFAVLGMISDADEELEAVSEESRLLPEVLGLRVVVDQAAERWDRVELVTLRLRV